jgi:hypothetical protein
MTLNIKNKNTGDLLTATEFNLVVQAVKDNESDIEQLGKSAVKMVAITQTDYDALVASGKVDADTWYNILEEE